MKRSFGLRTLAHRAAELALAEESRLRAVVAECDQALTECAWLQATLEEANKAMESPQSAPQSEQSLATVGARVAAADDASARAWTPGARPANLTLSGPRSRLLRRPAVLIRPS